MSNNCLSCHSVTEESVPRRLQASHSDDKLPEQHLNVPVPPTLLSLVAREPQLTQDFGSNLRGASSNLILYQLNYLFKFE